MDDYVKAKSVKLLSEGARDKVLEGVDRVADAVKVTMGPAGKLVLYDGDFGTMGITKDGVTVARNIKFDNAEMNLGAKLIKQAANRTLKGAGDGTTTTCVLAQSLIHSGLNAVNTGANVAQLTRDIKSVIKEHVIDKLPEYTRNLDEKELIDATANMSTNHDEELSSVVSEVFNTYGKDIVVNIENSDNGRTHVSVVPGISINRGYTRANFAPADSPITKFENCGILILDDKVNNPQMLFKNVIQPYFSQPPFQPLLIIANDFPEAFEADLYKNRVAGIPVLPVRAPYYGQKQKDYLKDIAVFTSAIVISETDGVSLSESDLNVIGTAELVMVDMKSTSIINTRKGDFIDSYVEELRVRLDNTTEEGDIENLKERISKLLAGICSIKVHADSDAELQEKKDRLDDAVRAVRVALDKGVCAGGGSILYYLSQFLPDSEASNIVKQALQEPLSQLVRNAGHSLLELLNRYRPDISTRTCYNLLTDTFEDIHDTEVLDPVGVLESSLNNAVSIATQVLSLGAVISDVKVDTPQ